MRPTGNENKGAMKLRVDFKQKKTGNLFIFQKKCHNAEMLMIIAKAAGNGCGVKV